MPKVSLDFNTRKEIKVLMLKGEIGKSSYQLAVENELFSGTLEEWIETFSTPENYITRTEFQKVTQAEYDELEEQGLLIPNAFYLITNDATYDEIMSALGDLSSRVTIVENSVSGLTNNLADLTNAVNTNTGKIATLESQMGNKTEKTTGTITFSSTNTQLATAFANLILNHQGIKIYYTLENTDFIFHYDVITFIVKRKSGEAPTVRAFYINQSGSITTISDNTILYYEYIE